MAPKSYFFTQNPIFGPIFPLFYPVPPLFAPKSHRFTPKISFRACPSPSGFHPNFQPQNLLISPKNPIFWALSFLLSPHEVTPIFNSQMASFHPETQTVEPQPLICPKIPLFSLKTLQSLLALLPHPQPIFGSFCGVFRSSTSPLTEPASFRG